MRALGVGLVLAFALALALTPKIRRLAQRLGALDPFSARKLCFAPTVPRLGGLAVAAAFYLTLATLWLGRSVLTRATLSAETPVLEILAFGLPILLLGTFDDLYGLRALPKLTVEVLVSIGLWAAGLRIAALPNLLSLALTVAWLVGVMNATNLIDGLDGLASGVALFGLAATGAAALLRGDLLLGLLVVVLAGAVLGFLVYNLRPASIFLGDAGSLFLGYLLGATAVWSVRKTATAVLLVFPVVALGLPLLDTSLTISRRLLSGRPISQGDRDHVHHRLLGRFGPNRAIYMLYAVCAVFSGLAVAMLIGGPLVARLALLGAVLCALGLAYLSGYLRSGPQGLVRALRDRKTTQRLLRELDALDRRLVHRPSQAELVREVEALSAALGYPLVLAEADGTAAATASSNLPASSQNLRYPIGQGRTIYGYLVAWRSESELSPAEQTILQLLCDVLAPRLARIHTIPPASMKQ